MDAASGFWRPFAGPEHRTLIADIGAARRPRWAFAALYGAAVVAASVLSQTLGARRPTG